METRVVPATLFDGGTATLTIELAAGEKLDFQALASDRYFFRVQGSTIDDGGVADTADFSGLGNDVVFLESTGLARYDTIEVIDAGADARVLFLNSGAQTYKDDFRIRLDAGTSDGTQAVQLNGFNTFEGDAGLDVEADGRILVTGQTQADAGSIALTADTPTSNGIQITGSNRLVSSSSGDVTLSGTTAASGNGVVISGGGTVVSAPNGVVSITGQTASTPANQHGVTVGSNASVNGAEVSVDGTSTGGGIGVATTNSGTITSDGPLTIIGAGNNFGVGLLANSTITAAGPLTIEGIGNRTGVGVFNGSTVTAAGPMTIEGEGPGDIGVHIAGAGVHVTTSSGDLTITGTGGSDDGVLIDTGAQVSTTGTGVDAGTLRIEGESTSPGVAEGVRIDVFQGTGTRISAIEGAIELVGTSGTRGAGVFVNDATVESTGTGPNAATIRIEGDGGDFRNGVRGRFEDIHSIDGDITIIGTNTSDQASRGVDLRGIVRSTGTGAEAANIRIEGTSTSDGLDLGAARVESMDGDITLVGQGRFIGVILSNTEIEALGSGMISVTGSGTDSVGIQTFSTPNVITAASGAVELIAPVGGIDLMGSQITTPASITLEATDTPTLNRDNIRLSEGTTIESTGGTATLTAGDDLSIDAGSSVSADGTLQLIVDPPASDPDPGIGSGVRALGTLESPNVQIFGGDDPDGFRVAPSPTSVINVFGGDPAAPVDLGDQLTIATPDGETSTLNDNGDGTGTWTTTGGFQDVVFNEIESSEALELVVTTTADTVDDGDGLLSLREAAALANIFPTADAITFDAALAGDTITLTNGLIELTDTAALTTITGPDGGITIDGNDTSRIFRIGIDVPVELVGLSLTGGRSDTFGGAIVNQGDLTIQDAIFENNFSELSGGAIDNNGRLIIDQTTFRSNMTGSDGDGAAIFSDGILEITESLFENNVSGDRAGAIDVDDESAAPVLISHTTFRNNSAQNDGGALYLESPPVPEGGDPSEVIMEIRHSVFENNEVVGGSSDGGAIYFNRGYLVIDQSTFRDNTAGGEGGAIAADFANELTIQESTFQSNAAGIDGGAIFMDDTFLNVAGSLFEGNSADIDGGAIYNEVGTDGPPVIVESTFLNNQAGFGGGALFLMDPLDSTTQVRQSTFADNASGTDGGAIFLSQGNLEVVQSTLHDNSAGSNGGAIYSDDTLRVINSTFSNNNSEVTGAALYTDFGQTTVINSTITNNRSNSDGDDKGDSAVFTSASNGATTTLINTIVAGNVTGTGSTGEDIFNNAGLTAINSLIGIEPETGPIAGSGNIVGTAANPIDPLLGPLQDNGGPTLTHALLPGSPAIDAGSDADLPPEVTTDQRGDAFPRIVGAAVDIGAFEVQELTESSPPTVVEFNVLFGDGMRYDILNNTNRILPWEVTGIEVVFSEDVVANAESLELTGADAPTISAVSGSGSDTVTWTFADSIDAAALDALLASSGPDAITDLDGNALDGDVNQEGPDPFQTDVDVLLGDVSGDGFVNIQDFLFLRARLEGVAIPLPDDLFLDVDGDGDVDEDDRDLVRSLSGRGL